MKPYLTADNPSWRIYQAEYGKTGDRFTPHQGGTIRIPGMPQNRRRVTHRGNRFSGSVKLMVLSANATAISTWPTWPG